MSRGISITHFLVNGDPEGIICAYMSNWTGQSLKIPRNLLDEGKTRTEINRPGVYFLFGYNEENPNEKLVYVGEAENIVTRLYQHAKDPDKSFWTEAISFTSKDDNLTKSHIKYLEFNLIKIAKKSTNYTVINKTDSSDVTLPETAISDMETYLDNLKIILPTLGHNIIENTNFKQSTKKTNILHFELGNLDASGAISSNGFIVLKNSKVNKNIKDSLSNGYKTLRQDLIDKKIIEEKNGEMFFSQDYEFTSPSAAGAIIIGYPVNGRINWKYENGKTIKDIEEEKYKENGNGT
jgi:hypothetical protein